METFDPNVPPVAQPVSASAFTCMGCCYDLSGTALGASCPECGTPVEQTLRQFCNSGGRTSGYATASLVCGILGLFACGLLAFIAIALYFPAMKELRSGAAAGQTQGFAIAGLVMGIISSTVTILIIVLIVLRGGL